ncbi:hypothetical protein BDB00DRAFT_873810 [Zychaea mexicana]|uniref:uncharacterized protein n=1 Tax=Zychaea mexicana TaxID=64656 RepID=UPI0022FEBB37|nr:uncharacterized protein BDB00DRAFT_873810 [Zychaea mexicana]KAI9491975.1 hypothetical protein BDB00DRAFT_873810 [Zychaea mexicana]
MKIVSAPRAFAADSFEQLNLSSLMVLAAIGMTLHFELKPGVLAAFSELPPSIVHCSRIFSHLRGHRSMISPYAYA